ncbi:hypothetical protein LguiB_020599 [Lonicera macranthoides]
MTGRTLLVPSEYENEEKVPMSELSKNHFDREILPPPPPPPPKTNNYTDSRDKQQGPAVARTEEEDIFVGESTDYSIPGKDMSQSPISEDMEESPHNKDKTSYFTKEQPMYGLVPPSEPSRDWQQMPGDEASSLYS